MNPFKILLPSAAALTLASCASNNASQYDTGDPYGSTDAAPYQPIAPANQTYDTPAAYEEAGNTATSPNLPAPGPAPAINTAPAAGGTATTHVVVKGDTLSGIAAKYKVPGASIKQANGMTKDTVVLGKKLIIPAH